MYYQIVERGRLVLKQPACKDDPYPDDWHSSDEDRIERAKEVCWTCPVLVPCLDYAMTNDERFGIWGGLTEEERGVVHRTRF